VEHVNQAFYHIVEEAMEHRFEHAVEVFSEPSVEHLMEHWFEHPVEALPEPSNGVQVRARCGGLV
jgi:hypothetical protein